MENEDRELEGHFWGFYGMIAAVFVTSFGAIALFVPGGHEIVIAVFSMVGGIVVFYWGFRRLGLYLYDKRQADGAKAKGAAA